MASGKKELFIRYLFHLDTEHLGESIQARVRLCVLWGWGT